MLVYFSLARNAPVHEDVTLPTVAMNVAEKYDLVFLVVQCDKLFSEKDGRVEKAAGIGPPTIEVGTYEIAAIVADDDTIGV